MNRQEAIQQFGQDVVKMTVDAYENESGKVFFPEDCSFEGDRHPAKSVRIALLQDTQTNLQKQGEM